MLLKEKETPGELLETWISSNLAKYGSLYRVFIELWGALMLLAYRLDRTVFVRGVPFGLTALLRNQQSQGLIAISVYTLNISKKILLKSLYSWPVPLLFFQTLHFEDRIKACLPLCQVCIKV